MGKHLKKKSAERLGKFFCSRFRSLCAENPDLVQLKSLLAGLTLPVKSSSAEVSTEERDGKSCCCPHLILMCNYTKATSDHFVPAGILYI